MFISSLLQIQKGHIIRVGILNGMLYRSILNQDFTGQSFST